MISRKVDLLLKDNTAKLKENIFLYKGDYGIKLRFNIMKELDYYLTGDSYIEENSLEGSNVVVLFKKPSGESFYTEESKIEDGYVTFIVTNDMTDEFNEIGDYKLQIRLVGNDYRLTIPSICFNVGELISDIEEDDTEPIVDRAIVGKAKLLNSNSISLFSIDKDGYIRTYWQNGDIITKERLNNIEEGIEYLYQKIDELSYKAITINSFNLSVSQAELGQVINSLTMNWSCSKNPTSQNINGTILETTARTYIYSTPLNSNKTFTLTVSDGKTTVSRNASITFNNCKYYGTSLSSSYDATLISSLTKNITGSRTGSWTVNARENEYIFFAIPTRYGTPSFNVGGFDGGFSKVNTIQYTNNYDYTESYDIYKSDNHSLGNTTVTVK